MLEKSPNIKHLNNKVHLNNKYKRKKFNTPHAM